MKNAAVQKMLAKQYNVSEEDVSVTFQAKAADSTEEFEVTVLNKEESGRCGTLIYDHFFVFIKTVHK